MSKKGRLEGGGGKQGRDPAKRAMEWQSIALKKLSCPDPVNKTRCEALQIIFASLFFRYFPEISVTQLKKTIY